VDAVLHAREHRDQRHLDHPVDFDERRIAVQLRLEDFLSERDVGFCRGIAVGADGGGADLVIDREERRGLRDLLGD
jgi:hypothetical protein